MGWNKVDVVIRTVAGAVTIIRRLGTDAHYNTNVEAKCFCGTVFVTRLKSLKSGNTSSCGCYRDALRKTRNIGQTYTLDHGHATRNGRTDSYDRWANIIQRCENPKNPGYRWYGARGIAICAEWRNSFESFFKHVGPCPAPGLSLDRIDNDGNYEPGNVRWATITEQIHNSRTKKENRHVE